MKVETISTMIPSTSTTMVLREQPFHSLRMIPHTLENTTLSAISMQKANVISAGESVRKPFPRLSPKNWLYHKPPAKTQNHRLVR